MRDWAKRERGSERERERETFDNCAVSLCTDGDLWTLV